MIGYLKKELEKKAGFRLDTVSAFRKFEKILYANGIQVSYSTLNRLFSETNTTIKPRVETLNLLSKYLGYRDFDDLEFSTFSEIKKDELYFKYELELKSLLLNKEYKTAIDLYLELRNELGSYHTDFTQIMGKAIFNNVDFDHSNLAYLLEKEVKAPFFLEYFVNEDDIRGHYRNALQNMDFQSENPLEKELFKSFYLCRKNLLNQKLFELPEVNYLHINYHLQARYFELLLLNKFIVTKTGLENFVLEMTEKVIELLNKYNNGLAKLVITGRWCRALCYTGTYGILCYSDDWKQQCINSFMDSHENIEFKAPIYAFLKLNYGLNLPLDFYKTNRWENALVESEMIISMALKNEKAVRKFQKLLNIKLPFI